MKKDMGTGLQKMMKRRKKSNTIACNILSLPNEMLASILASVASSSIIDLIDAKLVCKQFSEAALDYLVFQRVTLKTIPSTSWTERSPQKSYFLKQCEEAKNPDAIYNLGMYHYFSYRDFELGYNLLKNSADSGHLPSIYALGMILVSEKKSQHEVTQLLDKINNLEIRKCRRRIVQILNKMWIHHTFQQEESRCLNFSCRNGGKRGLPTREQWSRREEDQFCSQQCKWSFEYYLLCKEAFNCR